MGHICRAASRNVHVCFVNPVWCKMSKQTKDIFTSEGEKTTRPMRARPACLTITLGSASSEGNVLSLLPVLMGVDIITVQCIIEETVILCIGASHGISTF